MDVELRRVTEQENLVQINDFVHDWEFDLDKVKLNEAQSALDIEFTKEVFEDRIDKGGWIFKRISIPIVRCRLRIHHVNSYEIVDTEKIGRYPFETIEYDSSAGLILVNTVIPLEFRICVTRLDMSIIKDDVPTGFKDDWMFGI